MTLLVPYYIRKAQGIAPPPPLREEDLRVEFYTTRDQPVYKGPVGVTLIHVPTRTRVSSGHGKSQLENKIIALRRLKAMLS